MPRSDLRFAAAALACLSTAGCGSNLDAPDTAIRHVLAELANNNPRALWDSLPRSYQDDVQGLIHAIAGKLDPEVYDQAFALGRRFLKVADAKRELVLGQLPMLLPRETVEELWDPILGMCRLLMDSSISSVKGLRRLDLGAFLGDTGGRAMTLLARAIEKRGGATPRGVLGAIQDELASSTGETATVRVSSPQHGVNEQIAMAKVDGRWIPSPMAQGWSTAMGQARAAVDRLPSMTEGPMKAMAKAELTRIEQQLDALEAATTREAFAAALRNGSRQPPARPR